MNTTLRRTAQLAVLILSALLARAGDATPTAAPEPPPPGEPRAMPHPGMGGTMRVHRIDRTPPEMEKVTFLGVETSPVSKTLVAQLNLPNGAGLVVVHVVPGTSAAGALQENDILLKLDDQILIDQHQLAVLIRNHHADDEITLTYVRGGKQATAKVKLTTHEVPKVSDMFFWSPGQGDSRMPGHFNLRAPMPDDPEHVERMLSMVDRAHKGEPMRIEIEHGDGPGIRATGINTSNSSISLSDQNGTMELTIKDGKKTLLAKDLKGNELFSGPVNTPEERQKMPAEVRERLEKLESMRNVTFHTDGDFEGVDTWVVGPGGTKIMSHGAGPARRESSHAY